MPAALLLAFLLARPAGAGPGTTPTAASEAMAAEARAATDSLLATEDAGVDHLAALALLNAPSLAALSARVAAAEARVRPAGAWPNPMLEVTLQDFGTPDPEVTHQLEPAMYGPELTQPVPFPGKRGARRAAARADAAVEAARLAALRRQVVRDVRVAYANLYAVEHDIHCQASSLELLDLLAATARQRYAAGQGDQGALLAAQLRGSRVRERLADLAAERAGWVATLNILLGRAGDAPLAEVEQLPATSPAAGAWADSAVTRSAELERWRGALRAAERRVTLARVEGRPDFAARAGIAFRDEMDPVITLGLGMELPLWNGQSRAPLVEAARQELEAARQELRQAEAEVRGAAARVAADETRARATLERYEQAIVPQSSLAFDAARSAYLAGRGDFPAVLEQFDLWLEARAGQARREADVFIAWAERDALLNAWPAEGEESR